MDIKENILCREGTVIETFSEKETYDFAYNLAKNLKTGDIITLDGDLGVGKTIFSKGIAKGLGVESIVSSPTFSIINEYDGDIKLYHLDVYRINSEDELYDIGFYEMLDEDAILLIEWACKIADYIPEHISVNIEKDLSKGENYRKIYIVNRKK